jgi:hypothetical protein
MIKSLLIDISCVLTFVCSGLSAQEDDLSSAKYIASETVKEEIFLFTDRTLYSTNEQIFFSAKYFASENMQGKTWSTVLYLELIMPDGTAIVQNKYPLSKAGASGYIDLPKELRSGIYYLKAYTKWMRNYPPGSYAYCPIKVVNPNRPKLNKVSENTHAEVFTYQAPQKNTNIALATNKARYGSREKVTVSFTDNQQLNQTGNYIISVVRKGSKSTSEFIKPEKELRAEQDTALFYPEINGLSLSGRILTLSGKAVEYADVNLSLLNKQSYFSSFMTNGNGEFFFSFPESTNKHDFFIDAKKGDLSLNIELDKEFCSKPFSIKEIPFELSEEEKILAEEICLNAQISEAFKETSSIGKDISEDLIERSFYGSPDQILYTKDYIDLPYIDEFIFELVHEILITNKKGIASISTSDRHSLSSFPFLVLVDNIPISDISLVSKIRTNKVERLEVIAHGYVIGNNKYSGILHIFTQKKDLAGIDLPKNSMFFGYSSFADKVEYPNFNWVSPNSRNSRIPDRRNCLYWNPNFQLVNNKENNVSFYTSDTKGSYQVIVQAVTKDGSKLIIAKTEFVVE